MPPTDSHHRHQSSLEGIIDFSARPPLTAAQRLAASARFNRLIDHFEVSPDARASRDYDRMKLVRLTHEYAITPDSQGNFLRAFFEAAGLLIDENEDPNLADPQTESKLRDSIVNFADYLFNNFFLPLKASTKKTPQPSPASHSAVQRAQSNQAQPFLGTPERVSTLRALCLLRDRHRCVISRQFDETEALRRIVQARGQGSIPQDDDGGPLRDPKAFDYLEVAHILPHSLTQVNADKELDPSKVAVLAILNMFDSGAAFLIEGTLIDRPLNAMTLTQRLHRWFGDFQVFFEPVAQQAHTYRIDTFIPEILGDILPVTQTLFLTESRTIDPPSPRLLAIHRAVAHILHLSAAGEYIDSLLRDLEEFGIREDGSTRLDHLVKLRLDGWPVGEVNG